MSNYRSSHYIAGLLFFHEIPASLGAFKKLQKGYCPPKPIHQADVLSEDQLWLVYPQA
jgi:hypothetical protein